MSDRLMEAERTVSALRPQTLADPQWADPELRRIISTPPSRAIPRPWRVAGGAVAALVAVSGTAYAGGLIPMGVTERLGRGDQTSPLFRVGHVREVFALTTASGSRVQLFAAPNEAGGQCWTVTRDIAPDAEPADLSFTCEAGSDRTFIPSMADGIGILPTDRDFNSAPILFGLDLGEFELPAGTRQIRVTAPGFERTVTAQAAEGWAIELPATSQPATYIVAFLDTDGDVLRRVREEVDPGSPQ
jgi:hypothetical protein